MKIEMTEVADLTNGSLESVSAQARAEMEAIRRHLGTASDVGLLATFARKLLVVTEAGEVFTVRFRQKTDGSLSLKEVQFERAVIPYATKADEFRFLVSRNRLHEIDIAGLTEEDMELSRARTDLNALRVWSEQIYRGFREGPDDFEEARGLSEIDAAPDEMDRRVTAGLLGLESRFAELIEGLKANLAEAEEIKADEKLRLRIADLVENVARRHADVTDGRAANSLGVRLLIHDRQCADLVRIERAAAAAARSTSRRDR